MKRKEMLLFLVLLIPLFCTSQNLILPNINVPGEVSLGAIKGAVLGENLMGPRKITFAGNKMNFQRPETGGGSSGSNIEANIDKLETWYSGKIYSPGIAEPFIFTNKTGEELILIEVSVFPTRLEQPYTLLMDLDIRTKTKPISANQSDDAGIYTAQLLINITQI